MSRAFATAITWSHWADARALAATFHRFHREPTFVDCAGDPSDHFNPTGEPFTMLMLDDVLLAEVPTLGLFGPAGGGCFTHPSSHAVTVFSGLECEGCHHHPTRPRHGRSGCPNAVQYMAASTPEGVFKAVQCLTRRAIRP